mgnify:CR=1 FL=1
MLSEAVLVIVIVIERFVHSLIRSSVRSIKLLFANGITRGVARVAPSPPNPLLPPAGEGEKDSMHKLASVGLRTTADPISPSGLRSVLRAQQSGARNRNRNRCVFSITSTSRSTSTNFRTPPLPFATLGALARNPDRASMALAKAQRTPRFFGGLQGEIGCYR